jgi:hypothetical protein
MATVESISPRLAAADLESFALLVNLMRLAQTEYFKTQDRNVLISSKQLEAKVDAAVKIILGEGVLEVTAP